MNLRKLPQAFNATLMDGELVMIHADTGRFFALKDVGLDIWNLLDDESDLERIRDELVSRYAIDAQTCQSSVSAFADQLVAAGFAEYR